MQIRRDDYQNGVAVAPWKRQVELKYIYKYCYRISPLLATGLSYQWETQGGAYFVLNGMCEMIEQPYPRAVNKTLHPR
jgi:hypothetical protein